MKELNNIYEALNHMDFDMDDYEKEELNDIEKRKLKRQFRKSRKKPYNFKKIGSIAATIILILGILGQTSFMKNAYAYVEYKLTELYYSIENILNLGRDLESYSNVVNKVVKSDGIEMKLTDVIIDEDLLIVAAIVDIGDRGYKPNFYDHDIYINGEIASNSSTRSQTESINEENTMFTSLYEFRIRDIDLSKRIDLRIVFRDMPFKREDQEEVIFSDGIWEFEFTASGHELMADTKTIPLDYSLEFENGELIFEKLSYNVVNQKIYGKYDFVSYSDLETSHIYAIRLRGEDNLGNKVQFLPDRVDWYSIEFRTGRRYLGRDTSILLDEAEYITLIPYMEKNLDPFGFDYEKIGEAFTIYLDN